MIFEVCKNPENVILHHTIKSTTLPTLELPRSGS
ncbi:MAG: hypothetical protein PWP07_1300 [Epulopiscium sp.]|jgi:hypothetical protein|nr:hypothetical protein [Defluviitaleaceae bacterium]MDK2788075.1 hypothetical protein [Candidatus Epulonipiscium sp.]